jgi:hypothetical protein
MSARRLSSAKVSSDLNSPRLPLPTDMARFPAPAHVASWARFAPGVSESAGRKKGNAVTGHGNRYLARAHGDDAVGAARTDTFLGEWYRRIAASDGSSRPPSHTGLARHPVGRADLGRASHGEMAR